MCIFFFKQKTAYEMRISDWSSDVCSSDLQLHDLLVGGEVRADNLDRVLGADLGMAGLVDLAHAAARQQGLYLIGVADQAADLEKGRMVVAARGRAEAAGRAAAAAGVFAHCRLLASRGRSARLSETPAAPPRQGSNGRAPVWTP